jgi:hypothetical protein
MTRRRCHCCNCHYHCGTRVQQINAIRDLTIHTHLELPSSSRFFCRALSSSALRMRIRIQHITSRDTAHEHSTHHHNSSPHHTHVNTLENRCASALRSCCSSAPAVHVCTHASAHTSCVSTQTTPAIVHTITTATATHAPSSPTTSRVAAWSW